MQPQMYVLSDDLDMILSSTRPEVGGDVTKPLFQSVRLALLGTGSDACCPCELFRVLVFRAAAAALPASSGVQRFERGGSRGTRRLEVGGQVGRDGWNVKWDHVGCDGWRERGHR